MRLPSARVYAWRSLIGGDSLPGLQGGQVVRVGVEVHVAGDAANAAGAADLPVGPVVLGAGIPGIAAIAAAPRIAGVEVFTVVVGDPAAESDAGVQIAGTCSGAAIDDRAQGDMSAMTISDDVRGPVVEPLGVGAGSDVAGELFEVNHRHEALAVGLDVTAGMAPEVS